MKPLSLNELKKELTHLDSKELLSCCVRLAKFKKENKELLTFILFEENDLNGYIENLRKEITAYFEELNHSNVYYLKKSLRKILRYANKHIKFAGSKQVEAEILIYFCNSVIDFSVPLHKSRQLSKMYAAQLDKIDLSLSTLHPDLQYDLRRQLKKSD
jgi:hypothetical protein